MTRPFDDQPSKGMAMIAAYRAARLGQRPVLRSGLQQSRIALRHERGAARPPATEPPGEPLGGTVEAPLLPAISPLAGTQSVFAGLVGTAGAAHADRAQPHVPDALEPAENRQEAGMEADDGMVAVDPPTLHPNAPAEDEVPRDETPSCEPPSGSSGPGISKSWEPGLARPASCVPLEDPPLAEIGFGPGMLIRFSQLGLSTIGDLAQADAAQLRVSLGDISRLVDVETWINSARQSVAQAGGVQQPDAAEKAE